MNNETILQEFLQKIWNEKQKNLIGEYVYPEYKIHLDNGDRWEGKTLDNREYERRLDDSFIPFPDINFAIRSIVSDGEQVAITWLMTGTNTGPIGELPPTGKAISTFGSTFYYFKNHKVCGHSQIFDRLTIMKQLGFAN